MAVSEQAKTSLVSLVGSGVTRELVGILDGAQEGDLSAGTIEASTALFVGTNGASLFVTDTTVTVNVLGEATVDFVAKGDTNANLLRVDASADAIGVGTATPSAKSILELSSTTRGFLPPRMTEAERDAITSPPAGLVIYNTTTNKLNFRAASAWEAVTSA